MDKKHVQIIAIFLAVIMIGSIFAYTIANLYDKDEEKTPFGGNPVNITFPENITTQMLYTQYYVLNSTEQNWVNLAMNYSMYGVEFNETEYPVPSYNAWYTYAMTIEYLNRVLEEQYKSQLNNSTNGT